MIVLRLNKIIFCKLGVFGNLYSDFDDDFRAYLPVNRIDDLKILEKKLRTDCKFYSKVVKDKF